MTSKHAINANELGTYALPGSRFRICRVDHKAAEFTSIFTHIQTLSFICYYRMCSAVAATTYSVISDYPDESALVAL